MTNYIKADGFDEAIIGIDTNQKRIIYSKQQMINTLVLDGLSVDESLEFLEHNTWNSSNSENGPIYMDQMNHDELIEMIDENMD
jgi:hypothetical protein